jgi:hypothetical protein
MEAKRLQLHDILCEIMSSIMPDGDRHVYFRPPPSVRMSYPAIKYLLHRVVNLIANNSVYRQKYAYKLTVIDTDPDSIIADKLSRLPNCAFDTAYVTDNLNHWVYIITI